MISLKEKISIEIKGIEYEYERKKLSHWEREFMRHKEEQRQKWLKEQVKRKRKQEQRSFGVGKIKTNCMLPMCS